MVIPIPPELAANLASDCESLTKLEGVTGKDLLTWNVTNIPKATECKWKHDGTREAYNNVRQVLIEFNIEKNK